MTCCGDDYDAAVSLIGGISRIVEFGAMTEMQWDNMRLALRAAARRIDDQIRTYRPATAEAALDPREIGGDVDP